HVLELRRTHGATGGNLYEPGTNYVLAPWITQIELERVVVNIAGAICCDWSGKEYVGVAAKRIEVRDHSAVRFVQLINRSTATGNINKTAGQSGVKDWFPGWTAKW